MHVLGGQASLPAGEAFTQMRLPLGKPTCKLWQARSSGGCSAMNNGKMSVPAKDGM
jgi:hypothetical protein